MLYYNQVTQKVKERFLTLDGLNDYALIDSVPFNYLNDFSFFCRFNHLSYRNTFIFSAIVNTGGYAGFGVFMSAPGFGGSGSIGIWYNPTFIATASNVYLPNVINNLQIVRENNVISIYLNGNLVRTPQAISTATTYNSIPAIGRTTSSELRAFQGSIYNQSMVNYAKTLAEIEQDNASEKQSLDTNKGQYLYNIEFNADPLISPFQTQEVVPKTVTIFR